MGIFDEPELKEKKTDQRHIYLLSRQNKFFWIFFCFSLFYFRTVLTEKVENGKDGKDGEYDPFQNRDMEHSNS